MRDALQHRGPDDAGSWSAVDGRVALGHRRLSILDLSPLGHQPMVSGDGSCVVVFNGEIYNFCELRQQLVSAGHRFRGGSDTEVLLAAYQEWGGNCVARLRGMFAFAVFDARNQSLLLARDRAGEKPLFVSHTAGRLAFASELKALLAWPAMRRRVSLDALDCYLAFGYVAGDQCLVEGVRKLSPGHALRYSLLSDTVDTWPYWRVPRQQAVLSARPEALVEELGALLARSVSEQLVADVPVGILLSGGVDSSLITAMVAKVSATRVRTFNVSFPGHRKFDEAPFARLVASHFGTDHTELVVESGSVDLLAILAHQYDEPIGDPSMIPTYLISQLVRASCTVALGGDGGDELFGGYRPYALMLAQRLVGNVTPAPLRQALGALAGRLPTGLRGRMYLGVLALPPLAAVARLGLYFDQAARRALVPALRDRLSSGPESLRMSYATDGGTLVQQMTRADFHSYLPDDILVKVDRASMLASLEMRAPFLDHRLIEFAFGRVPDNLKVTVSRRKILLRMLAKQILPRTLNLTRKQGFSLPLPARMRGEFGTFMRETLTNAEPGLFDQGAVRRLIKAEERGMSNVARLFALTMLELWRREYAVELPM